MVVSRLRSVVLLGLALVLVVAGGRVSPVSKDPGRRHHRDTAPDHDDRPRYTDGPTPPVSPLPPSSDETGLAPYDPDRVNKFYQVLRDTWTDLALRQEKFEEDTHAWFWKLPVMLRALATVGIVITVVGTFTGLLAFARTVMATPAAQRRTARS